MDRLEQINNSINEIRDILDAECTPISELPNMVRSLAEISAKSGYTTAFLFSSKNKPATPTSGDLNISTGLIEDIDVDWSQTIETSPSNIHMSFAIFNPTGEKVKDWSAPISLKGPKGDPGATGPAGATGAKGEKGETGVSVSFRTVSVYTTTDTTDSPYKPVGGKWIFTTNEVEVPGGESEWFLNANEPPKKKFLWLSQATFGEDGNLVNDWCLPFRLTGEDGKDGVDGTLTEFIYRRLKDFTTYEALVKYLEDNELQSKNEQDFIPEDSFDAPDWTDRPMGIDGEFYKIEVCCTRKRKGVDEAWSDWSDCVIWSKWGEDGMDGDGIEYIYLVTPSTFNGEKITPEIVSGYFTPDRDAVLLEDGYQESEFCFNKDFGYDGYDWTDEPSDVGPDQPIEWVMVRKQKDGVWQKFSDPSIWATFAEDGAAYITSFIFARSIDEPDVPTGGSFDFPSKVDQSDVWFDTVPGGDLNIPVWMSTRTFKSGDNDWDSTWSKPKQIVDTNDFQVEYSSYVNPNNPNNPPQITDFTGDEDEWRKSNPNWSDYIDDAVWMATCRCSGGVWEKWVVTRIKGEKGDKGEAGSSVAIEGQFETKEELLAAWTKYVTSGDVSGFYFESADKTIDQGDGWYVTTEGKLYSYSGGWSEGESDTDFDKYWFSTTIKGEPGDTFYAYTAYSDSYPVTEISLHPGKPMSYIGLWYSNKVWKDDAPERKDPNNYEWTKWSGEDGWGYEQIFLLTHKNLPYNPNGKECPLPLREAGDNVPEYLPKHPFGWGAKPFTEASNYESEKNRWSDTPLSPTEEYPYCWVAYRKTNGKEFGDWKGNRNGDIETASLYSRYTVDGVSGVYLEFSNDFAYIPTENDHIDPDFIAGIADGTIDPIQTIVRAYIGDEPANALQLQIDGEHITVEGDIVTLNVDEITPDVTEISLKITVGDTVYNKSWKLFYSSVGYNLYPDTLVLKRDNLTGKLVDSTLNVAIKKWDGKKFVETGIPLFGKVSFDDGKDDQILSTESEITPSTGGIATIDLTKILANPTNIHLYVVEQDEDGNYVSTNPELPTPQDIGIIFDGKNTYTINLTNDLGIVPLEEDGTIDAQAEKIETKIEMYEGNEVATGVKYSLDKEYTGVTLSNNLVTIIPSSFKSAEDVPTEIVCYAEKDNIKLSKTFKLLTTKNAYELFVDKNVLTKNPYNGELNESVIECTLKRWDSINNQYKLPDNISDLYVHVECKYADASEQKSVVNSKFNESGTITLDLKDEKGLVTFRLYVSSESTLTEAKNNWLTYEDIGVIADGQSVYHLELTNEFTMIATDDAGNPNTDWDEDDSDENQDLAYSEAQMYLGAEEVEATYLWEITTGTGKLENANSAKCSLVEMSTDTVTIRCTATYDKISQCKDFNVVKSKGQPVYQIVPSASLFVYAKDNGPLIGPHEIQCTINKWTGSKYEQITDLESEGLTLTDESGKTLSDGVIKPKKAVQIVYLKKEDLVMDQETFGFVEGGSKGTDALHLELSNEFTMVPTNDQGDIDASWDEESDEGQDLAVSTATLYLGTKQITPQTWKWEIVEENGGELEYATSDTCSVTAMNLDAITVKCTATYNGDSISKEMRVVKSKGAPVYKLIPSAALFIYDKDGSTEASPTSITFTISKWDGFEFSEISSEDGLSLVDENGNSITSLTPEKRERTVYLKYNNVVVDKETIGFVEGGSRGTDGTSPLHIELTNDFTMVATDSEGNLISGWDEDLSDSDDHDFAVTEAQIFYGINNVTNDCTINWDIYPSNGGVRQVGETGAKFSLVEMSADALTIRCIANYGKATVTKDFNVVKSKGQDVYKIVPSHTAFVGDKLGNVTPDSITINVSKWTNGTYSIVNAEEEGLTLSHSTLTPTQGNQTVTLKKDGVLLDTETIGYIESGKDGLNAVALFKSTVFTRSNDDLSDTVLSGGSYENPKPDDSDWHESIPDGDAQLWAATRTFSSDNKWEENWSKPVKMTDTSSFEAVFGIKTASRGDLPVDVNGFANPGNYTNGWDDEPKDDTEYWFMATATSKNGVWSKWTVSQIKGENGKNGHSIVMHETEPTNPEMGDGYVNDAGELLIWDGDSWVNCGVIKGKDGKDGEAGSAGKGIVSTEVVYAITDNQETTPSDWYSTTPILEQGKYLWTKTTWKYTDGEEEVGYQKTYIPTDGSDGQDGEAGKAGVGIASTKVEYVISDSGTVTPETGWDEETPILENGKYLWTKTTWTYTDNTNESGYSVTYIGIDGKNNFIHVKYASEVTVHSDGTVSGIFTESDGEVPGKYMGVCVDENIDDPTDFNAYKWTKAEGEDGFGYEYIYQRTNSNAAPDIPTEKTADDVAPNDWTDSPTGVNENNMYEWVCWRKKVNGEWTDWKGANNSNKATLWAKWGETGQTGDSGEDAVYLELSNEAEMVPCDGEGNVDATWSTQTTMTLYKGSAPVTKDVTYKVNGKTVTSNIVTINKDYITGLSSKVKCEALYNGITYTKEMTLTKSIGVTAYKLVPSATAIRRDKNGNFTPTSVTATAMGWSNGKWVTSKQGTVQYSSNDSSWSPNTVSPSNTISNIYIRLLANDGTTVLDKETIPIIWDGNDGQPGGQGDPGVSKFKSTVFVRTNGTPSTPSGGSFSDPTPDDDSWKDGIPSGDAKLWASSRTFSSDGNHDANWSDPVVMASTSKFTVKYTKSDVTDPGTPDTPTSGVSWVDTASTGAIWMATRVTEDGVAGSWSVSKIKGETGATGGSGAPGVSPTITKKYALSETTVQPTDFSSNTPLPTTPTNKYCWCRETITQGPNSTSKTQTYVVSIHGETGPAGVGSTGAQGPIIYPAGTWRATASYSHTVDTNGNITATPYVYWVDADTKADAYYKLLTNIDASTTGNPEPSRDTQHWQKIDYFDTMFASVGMFNQATVGQFVFHKNYVFSQEGVDASGVAKTYNNYTDPASAIESGTFKPNILFNAVTGDGNLKKVSVEKVNTNCTNNGVDASVVITGQEITMKNGSETNGVTTIGSKEYFDKLQYYCPVFVRNEIETLRSSYQTVGNFQTSGEYYKGYGGKVNVSNIIGKIVCPTNNAGDTIKVSVKVISGGDSTVYEKTETAAIDSNGDYHFTFDGFVAEHNNSLVVQLKHDKSGAGVQLKLDKLTMYNTSSETQSLYPQTFFGKDGCLILGGNNFVKLGASETVFMYGSCGIKISINGLEKTYNGGLSWEQL